MNQVLLMGKEMALKELSTKGKFQGTPEAHHWPCRAPGRTSSLNEGLPGSHLS